MAQRGRRPANDVLPVFRLRDIPTKPARGAWKGVPWMQFTGTVQLRLPLAGWDGLTNEEFEVRLGKKTISVTCTRQDGEGRLADLTKSVSGELKSAIMPEDCWYNIEPDLYEPHLVLVIELAKACHEPWTTIFEHTSRTGEDVKGLNPLKSGRPPDVQDPYLGVARGFLCLELQHMQTYEELTFRIILDAKKLDEVIDRASFYNKIFGVDVSAEYFKLFIRGDDNSPVLMGALGGRVQPDHTTLNILWIQREVEGHRIKGTMEELPCLDVTLKKHTDSLGDWDELIREDEEVLNNPQGSLEDYERRLKREPSPDREDYTPDDHADEQKEKADAAFKAENYRDAVVYYTRGLRFTPQNEKLLSNRSATYAKLMKFQLALDDALEAERINPRWSKIYFRKGHAYRGLRKYDDAIVAYEVGKDLDPANAEWDREIKRTQAMKSALEEKRKAKAK